MANEDVLRLRATVVSEEALANIRAIGREIGLVPQRARPGLNQLNTQFSTLANTVKNLGDELLKVAPGLSGFGLGAAGAGLAAATLVRTLSSISAKIVELQYASKELGMSERDLRAWSKTAERAGIAPEAMMEGLKGFRRTAQEFKYNIGGVRDELIAMGAGPVVSRIMNAKDQTEKLKEAFDFKDALMKADPTGYKARKFFEMIQLGADAARLSFAEFQEQQAKTKPMSQEDIDNADKFRKGILDLGEAWDKLLKKTAVKMFPMLMQDIDDIKWILGAFEKVDGFMDKWLPGKGGNPMGRMVSPFVPSSKGTPLPQSQQRGPRTPAESFAMGYQPMAFHPGGGGIIGGGAGSNLSEFSKAVKDGVFAALVDFKTYTETGGAGRAGDGFTHASFGGSAGAAAGGGMGGSAGGAPGFGGGGYTNLTPGAGGGTSGGQSPPVYDPGTGKVIGNTGGAGVPGGSRGGSGGISAPAGTPIAHSGLATVTTASGKNFQVDSRFAQNFQGFVNDYEKSGGVIGPDSGTLGSRPHNASGHPIGAAIDINQIGRGVRSHPGRGVSLPPGQEDELAAKWGLVSGNQWRSNDQGHFGVKTVEDARQALIRNGVEPGQATDIATAQSGGKSEGGKTVKGSWFGSGPGWHDPSELVGRKTASGQTNQVPGIALPDRSGLGKMFEVTTPDGRKFMLPQTDLGPAKSTGRGIDITSAAATQMGYSAKNFPTDKGFSYRRLDGAVDSAATGGQKVEGNVNLTVNSNGTAAKTNASSDGLWQKTTIQNYKQMQKTEAPSWGPS
jgi:hypothetical protein